MSTAVRWSTVTMWGGRFDDPEADRRFGAVSMAIYLTRQNRNKRDQVWVTHQWTVHWWGGVLRRCSGWEAGGVECGSSVLFSNFWVYFLVFAAYLILAAMFLPPGLARKLQLWPIRLDSMVMSRKRWMNFLNLMKIFTGTKPPRINIHNGKSHN